MPDSTPRPRGPRPSRPQQGRLAPRQDKVRPEDPTIAKILTLANEVMQALGPGLPPPFYRQLFTTRLQQSGLTLQLKPRGVLKHREQAAAVFTPDFLCETSVVLDLHEGTADLSQAQIASTASAQKFFNAAHGLVLHFARNEVLHRHLHQSNGAFPTIPHEEIMRGHTGEKHDDLRATMLCRALLRVGRSHGLGFCQATYRGLLRAEFTAESLDFSDEPTAAIVVDGTSLGECPMSQIMTVQRSGALLVLAQQDGIHAADKQRLAAACRYLQLPWGLIAHFGRRRFEWQWL